MLEKSVESRYLGDFEVEKPMVSHGVLETVEILESEKKGISNILGDENGPGIKYGPRKIELQVQLPSCLSMRKYGSTQRVHLDTNWDGVDVSHWINVRNLCSNTLPI